MLSNPWFNAFQFLLETTARFFILLMLLRFFMLALRAPFHVPPGEFVVRLTNWLILPLRRLIPAWRAYDSASVVAAWLVALVQVMVLQLALKVFLSFGFGSWLDPMMWLGMGVLALVEIVRMTLVLFMGAALLQALFSWGNSAHPMARLAARLANPLLRPIRKLVPPIGGVDLSSLLLLLLLQLILIGPLQWLSSQLMLSVSMVGV